MAETKTKAPAQEAPQVAPAAQLPATPKREAWETRSIPEPNTGCWLWLGSLTKNGYGQVSRDLAHRRTWKLYQGPIPQGLEVLHRCDVRCCVNPSHLFIGTQADNMDDMRRKGRGFIPSSPFGEAHHLRVLTNNGVLEMRQRHASGESIQSIADDLDIHPATARDAIRGATWKHLQ